MPEHSRLTGVLSFLLAQVEMLKELGCDRVVDYRTENLKDVLKNEFPRCVLASSGLSDSCCAADNTTPLLLSCEQPVFKPADNL